jgi:hypothetical protein
VLRRFLLRALLAVLALATLTTQTWAEQRSMVRLSLDGEPVEGLPLAWSTRRVTLLSRDGRLLEFQPHQAESFRDTGRAFHSYTSSEIERRLMSELGNQFEITSTGHYLVAHPRGQSRLWSDRFESLYRSFVHYFSVRGFALKQTEFPLSAIVFPTQEEFLHYAQKEGAHVGRNVLGYYSNGTNRIALYDTGGANGNAATWSQNYATVIHEATHQMAFNTGIHTRLAPQPQWVVEGLGTLFEAPGIWNSRTARQQSDRLNRGRLDNFQQYRKGQRPPGSLVAFLASDAQFRRDPVAAYAEAWALTYYLVETQPRKFSEYLKRVAARRDFENYDEQARLDDFSATFGKNYRLFEAQFLKFYDSIR